ncbi:MAG: hypothetical protein ACYDAO_07830 [Thermoplasmataceae archaeon]
MLKVNDKPETRIHKIKQTVMKRLKDRFYIIAILLIVVGIIVLNYSYIIPKPEKTYLINSTFPVNINNTTRFYNKGFGVSASYSSNISFSNPNGTPFHFRLYSVQYLVKGGVNEVYNTTCPSGANQNVSSKFFSFPIHIHVSSKSLDLEISTNADHLNISVTEKEWFMYKDSSNQFFDEIGTPLIIAGIVIAAARLTYNTSSKTKERKALKQE